MLFSVNQQIVEWACEMHDTPALVIDTETTGGNRQDEVIDLGIVVAGSGRVLFDKLFRPEVNVNPHAYNVHGISDNQLIHANKFYDSADDLREILESAPIIAYNSSFDQRLLIQTFQRYGIPVPNMKFICAMNKFKQYTWQPKVISLTNACALMRVQAGSHRALTDALAAARVIYKMAKAVEPIYE